MEKIKVTTIGFTKTSAQNFFARLEINGVAKLIDVRLNNQSQLAGFAKARDLPFFLKKVSGITYEHCTLLAPTDDMLSAYKKQKGEWSEYEKRFLGLMEHRKIEDELDPSFFDHACLLCSEDTPHHCHRRLVCEYLNDKWGGSLTVKHL